MVLSAEEGGTTDAWRTRLRVLLEGGEVPSLDLLTRIDGLLAGPASGPNAGEDPQATLF